MPALKSNELKKQLSVWCIKHLFDALNKKYFQSIKNKKGNHVNIIGKLIILNM